MARDRQAVKMYMHQAIQQERDELGATGVHRLLDEAKKWNLGQTLKDGGCIVFPHARLKRCGHQIAAAVHACLDSGADCVLALGVLHAFSDALSDARASRMAPM